MRFESLSFVALIAAVGALPTQQYVLKQYPQKAYDQYDILRFLGTSSPYVDNPGYGINREVPSTCKVTQANLFARHGERYPTASKGATLERKLKRFLDNEFIGEGELEFLRAYEFKALDSSNYDNETTTGPYSGVVDMFKFGADFRNRYDSLIENSENTKFYTASQERVVVSAKSFARGFIGGDFDEDQIVIYDENDDTLGANSLTPVTSCSSFDDSVNDVLIDSFSDSYLDDIADRLNNLSTNANITKNEAGALLEYCGFELNVLGTSPICELFDTTEWVSYSYSNDLQYYYSKGPGNNVSSAIGSVYVGAIINLMKSDDFNVTLSFAHDTDIQFIISTLGVYDGDLPTAYQDFNAKYKTTNVVPMGARLIFERLECSGSNYLRFVLNDAVIPIPGHSSGPGFSVELSEFEQYIHEHLDGKNYQDTCEIEEGVAINMTIYWD